MTNLCVQTGLRYSPELLRINPGKFFVFGDNGDRDGFGGQACIRNEPNAIGLATLPHLGVFARDGDPAMMALMASDMLKIEKKLEEHALVFPLNDEGLLDIGTGIADLPRNAPLLFAQMQLWFKNLCAKENLDV